MIIAPSLLAADHTCFGREVARANRSGADWLHLDIMDGHFVPNISFGPEVVRALRPLSKLFFDVHLMCSKPDILLDPFARGGADQITIHVELGETVSPLIWKIKKLGKKVGLAVNPPTPIVQAQPYLGMIDCLLVMTVNPGFGGQSFIHETVPKIQQANRWRQENQHTYRVEVDGGVNFQTAGECAMAGADTFVSGTTLFKAPNLGAAVRKLRKVVNGSATATPATPPRLSAAVGLIS